MGPILLVDKSTVQGLNPEEITFMHKHYMVVVAPILMRELCFRILRGITNTSFGRTILRRISPPFTHVGLHAVVERGGI